MKDRMSLLRNVAMLSLASYVEMGFGLALGVVIARALGNVEFGYYAFAVWTCGTLITLCNNALTVSAIKFIAEARGTEQRELEAALQARLHRWQTWTSAGVLGAFLIAMVISPPEEWTGSVLAISSLVVVGAWSRSGYMMMASIGKGYERFEVESGALAASAAINLILVVLLSLAGGTLLGFFGIYAVCGLCQNVIARIVLRKLEIRPKAAPLPAPLVARLKRHLMQTGLLVVIGMLGDRTIEVLLLEHFSGPQALGFFAIAGALTKGATYLLAGALSSVLLPSMSRAFGVGVPGSVVHMLRESVRIYWFIGLMIAGMGIVVAPGVVRLFYGAEYEAAIGAVTINLVVAGAALIMAAFNAYQMASDRQSDRIRVVVATLAVNVVLAASLVPTYGLPGALASLALTKLATVLFAWRYVRRASGASMPVGPMARTLAAAAVGIALGKSVEVWLPGRFDFLVAGPLFVIGYLGSSIMFGSWTRLDFELFGSILGHCGPWGQRMARHTHRLGDRYGTTSVAAPLGKKEAASRVADAIGLSRLMGAIRPHVRRDLRVLAYHRVLPHVQETGFAFDKDLVSAGREEFEWQMKHIAEHYRPVSCQEVAEAIEAGRPLPKRAVMVTFDDGFVDNYEVAFPILKRHGVPAVFFVSTGFIDSGEMFWFDWLVHVILHTSATAIRIDAVDHTIEPGATEESRRAEAARFLKILKKSPESARLAALAELRDAAGVIPAEGARASSAPMTWDQAREMAQAGMEFGSHTVSHPILSTIADQSQLGRELNESKATLERELGAPVLALAYPVGGRDAINDSVLAATQSAGYRIAFTYQSGTNVLCRAKRFSLARIHVERYTTRARFKASLVLPEVFGA